jgi:hypothetical protein
MPATTCRNTSRLRDGVMKRGTTWSYVIRVKDPETEITATRSPWPRTSTSGSKPTQ